MLHFMYAEPILLRLPHLVHVESSPDATYSDPDNCGHPDPRQLAMLSYRGTARVRTWGTHAREQ